MGAVGAEHARQPKVGQLAHVTSRVRGRPRRALQQHVGTLQVTAHQDNTIKLGSSKIAEHSFTARQHIGALLGAVQPYT